MKDRLSTEKRLAAYIEGTLSEEEKSIIEEQLKESEEMRDSLSDLRNTIQLLKSLEEVDTPNWFTERIMSRVREGAGQKKGILERLFFPLHIKLPIEALAVIFLVVVSIFIYKSYQPEPDRIRSTQRVEQEPQSEGVWGDIKIIVNVEDMDNADNEVETAIINLGGVVLRKQSFENKNVLFVLLDIQKVKELYERLKPIGKVREEGDLSRVKGDVKVKIEIVKE